MLANTAGVKHPVILVNKMDDPTVEWDKSRLLQVECIPLISLCFDSVNGHILGFNSLFLKS